MGELGGRREERLSTDEKKKRQQTKSWPNYSLFWLVFLEVNMNNTDWAHIGFPLWESLDYAAVNYELPKLRVALRGARAAKPELR